MSAGSFPKTSSSVVGGVLDKGVTNKEKVFKPSLRAFLHALDNTEVAREARSLILAFIQSVSVDFSGNMHALMRSDIHKDGVLVELSLYDSVASALRKWVREPENYYVFDNSVYGDILSSSLEALKTVMRRSIYRSSEKQDFIILVSLVYFYGVVLEMCRLGCKDVLLLDAKTWNLYALKYFKTDIRCMTALHGLEKQSALRGV